MNSNKPQVMCCVCGTLIDSNPTNMCVNCIRTQIDITEGISKNIVIQWCKGCGRFAHNNGWVTAEPESKELLSMLVRKVRGLSKVKLIDASFVWTEAHSKRLKVKLTVQREVFGTGAVLQQSFVVEYVLENLYCPDCHKAQSPHTWVASVQLRQRGVGHKRTLYYVEQVILKRGAHSNVISLKEAPDGLDFYFVNASHAKRFAEFVGTIVPTKVQRSKKLISHDDNSNVFGYKYTWLVEIPPICKDDLVVLPRGGRLGEGGIFICTKVSTSLHFIDPFSLRRVDISGVTYWAKPFGSICSASRLQEYTVIDSEASVPHVEDSKYLLSDVTAAKSTSDFSEPITVKSHLGRLLRAGDIAFGYDVTNATFDLEESVRNVLGKKAARDIPEVILVRKGYRRSQGRKRAWTLQNIERDSMPVDNEKEDTLSEKSTQMEEAEGSSRRARRQRKGADGAAGENGSMSVEGNGVGENVVNAKDMEDLMREIEEDPEMRANVPLVKVEGAERIIEEEKRKREERRKRRMGEVVISDAGPDEEDDIYEEDDDDELDVAIEELIEPMKNLTLESRKKAIIEGLIHNAGDDEDPDAEVDGPNENGEYSKKRKQKRQAGPEDLDNDDDDDAAIRERPSKK